MGERRGTKALELWCRRLTEGYPGVKIENMTTSWRDGLAFCAMIHHFRPDLIEFEKLNKNDIYYNNELAFTTAEKYLGIPALLDAADMADYEVPDRLSILTYLSQFYQVFSAQESHNRLKRPSPAVEKTQIAQSQGPPPKMAHVIGVPRRDPCQKCKLPVFLAERLMVGKKVYHRVCLRCARCNSQLTPGSFYETEVDDEYCCETCPDEEELQQQEVTMDDSYAEDNEAAVQIRNGMIGARADGARSTTPPAKPSNSTRRSIADRLAFFEQTSLGLETRTPTPPAALPDAKLLQKSLSDEEKSKSLMRELEGGSSSLEGLRRSKERMQFLYGNNVNSKSELNGNACNESNDLNANYGKVEKYERLSAGEEMKMPDLPKTLPPTEELTGESMLQESNKRFKATAQLELAITTKKAVDELRIIEDDDSPVSLEETRHLARATIPTIEELLRTSSAEEKTANEAEVKQSIDEPKDMIEDGVESRRNVERKQELTKEIVDKEHNIEETTKEVAGELNDNDIPTVVAENMAVKQQETFKEYTLEKTLSMEKSEDFGTFTSMSTSTHSLSPAIEKTPQLTSPQSYNAHEQAQEDEETMDRLSVVKARLQQFEVKTHDMENENKHEDVEVEAQKVVDEAEKQNKEKLTENAVETVAPKTELKQMENNASPRKVPKADIDEVLNITESEEEEEEEEIAVVNELEKHINHKAEQKSDKNPQTPLKDMPMELEEPKEKQHIVPEIMTPEESNESVKIKEAKELEKNMNEYTTISNSSITTNFASPIKTSTELAEPAEVTPQTELLSPGRISVNSTKSNTSTMSRISNVGQYPKELDPFKSDDEEEAELRNKSLNPFDSSDDEVELEKSSRTNSSLNNSTPVSGVKVPPPRPPPPRISRNPFDEEPELEEGSFDRRTSVTSSFMRRTPVPTPRSRRSQSQTPTPEPTPRLSNRLQASQYSQQSSSITTSPSRLNNTSDYYGSANSLTPSPMNRHTTSATGSNGFYRNMELRASISSLASTMSGYTRSRKSRRAPAPPIPPTPTAKQQLFPSTETIQSTPSSSTVGTPRSTRKKRPAPPPPKPARHAEATTPLSEHNQQQSPPKNSLSYPLQSEFDSKSTDEEKALLEGKQPCELLAELPNIDKEQMDDMQRRRLSQRLIPLDARLLQSTEDEVLAQSDDHKSQQQQLSVRQLEKLKDNKEAKNRNRQSQSSSGAEDTDTLIVASLYNKSAHGKWKRRKGPAPAAPIPQRRILQMLPLQEIKQELEIIEVQQQGLERQGVVLEKMIRDRCEGENGELISKQSTEKNSKEVEDLILQLFELVNEKNELFRRQAELMYLRRQHRLEQEQADLEYDIRVLMAQPERNKTDTDKAREEALIARLVEVVQLRNEVIECLEMDRLREAEEDMSIKEHLDQHTAAQRDSDDGKKSPTKLSKKEKKKQKEAKKLFKSKKMDVDKDADESELSSEKLKTKKKKRKFIF